MSWSLTYEDMQSQRSCEIATKRVLHVIDSDQGPHFTATIIQKTAEAFNIKWDLHSP